MNADQFPSELAQILGFRPGAQVVAGHDSPAPLGRVYLVHDVVD